MELLAVLLALLVLAAPVLAISAVWRQRKLRLRLDELLEQTSQQNDALHRELLELRRQVSALSSVASPVAPPEHSKPAVAVEVAKPERVVAPAQTAIQEKPPEPRPAESKPAPPAITPVPPHYVTRTPSSDLPSKTEAILCPWCSTVHAGGVANCPPKRASSPTVTPRPETPRGAEAELRTSIPVSPLPSPTKPVETTVVQKHEATPAPPTPIASTAASIPSTPAAAPASTVPPAAPHDHFTPPRTVAEPPPSARVTPPPQFAEMRAPSPKDSASTSQQRMKSVFALEEALGTNWLNKLGITGLVLGLAGLGVWKFGQLLPLGKVVLSYFASIALLVGGILFEKRERYRILGRTLIGGGWALLFFTTYALNHVEAMRVMSSEHLDLILMLAVALAMVAHTLRYRSQLVTGLAFLLGYGTVSLSHDDVYSLSSGVILAVGLVSIVIKMGWFELEVFGILAGYLTHWYWLYRLLGLEGAQGQAFPEYHASTALLLFYWAIFRVSYVVRKVESSRDEHVSSAAALLNTLLLLGSMKFQSVHPELAFVALFVIGAAEFSIGQLPIIRRRREAFVVLSVVGAALMIAAVPFRYSGNNVAILWLVGAEALLIAGVMFSEVVFRRLGLLAGFLVGVHLAWFDFRQLIAVRQTTEVLVLSAGVMFALCALVFYVNAFFIGGRWREFFFDSPDSELLCGHSYIGAFAAASAAWALCAHDWTAVALAGIMFVLAALNKKFESFHVQIQSGLLAVLVGCRIVLVNLHSDAPLHTHVATRLLTLPILAVLFYVSAKLSQLSDESNQRIFRGVLALAGTALITALIYYEVPELWQPTAAIVFAVALLEIGQGSGYHTLAWHAHLLSGIAIFAAYRADDAELLWWHHIPLHALAALPVVAGVYWIARRIAVPDADHVTRARAVYTWAGTGVMVWLLDDAVPLPWIAVAWIVFAIVLALVMRRIGYRQLTWQSNVVSACAVARAFLSNFTLEDPLFPGVSLRMVTVSIVAAGLYFLSRKAVVSYSASKRAITYLHTFAATGLLAFLAWYEAPGAWLAAVWAVFALVLALLDRKFELEDLRWQAHVLALLAMARSVTVNLYIHETWHGMSIRLLSLAIVAVVMYALAQLIRMPEEWRARDFHHVYSWAASVLVSFLLWYELQPLTVAVGWGVFGLVLFEYGSQRHVRQFRFQAYVALAAAFGRIFFANLAAGNPGEFWGPRMYTVLPLALIFLFVYAQLKAEDPDTGTDRRFHLDELICYLGTTTVAAVLYFQFVNDWLATAWACVVFLLFGVALFLDRPIFLHQGILLTVGICIRGIMHNLFGASYFSGGDWTGRYVVLGSAIAALLACLPFAFRLRDRQKDQPLRGRWLGMLVRHPEQVTFFAPVLLLTLMLALKMRAGMVTVAWGVEALSILIFAFLINERSFRLTGLLLLLASFAKIVFWDMWSKAWSWPDRYITFVIIGAAMIAAHFLYATYKEKIRQLL